MPIGVFCLLITSVDNLQTPLWWIGYDARSNLDSGQSRGWKGHFRGILTFKGPFCEIFVAKMYDKPLLFFQKCLVSVSKIAERNLEKRRDVFAQFFAKLSVNFLKWSMDKNIFACLSCHSLDKKMKGIRESFHCLGFARSQSSDLLQSKSSRWSCGRSLLFGFD